MRHCSDSCHVIRLIEEFRHEDQTYIVTKLANGGTLLKFRRITDSVVPMPRFEALNRDVFLQIVKGVQDIHKHGIVHRDLKQENIFLSNDSEAPKIKIGDFGLAYHCSANISYNNLSGTLPYMSPEKVLCKPSGFKSDVWSLGVILYSMICGSFPFYSHESQEETIERITREELSFEAPVWDEVSEGCKDLIINMLQKDQKSRTDLRGILNHSWLTN